MHSPCLSKDIYQGTVRRFI